VVSGRGQNYKASLIFSKAGQNMAIELNVSKGEAMSICVYLEQKRTKDI
jgi:hypothetical protein